MLSKARSMLTVGGDNEASIVVCKLPLVFQRNETAVVMFVSGRFERLVALTMIWSSVRRAGRSLAKSSRLTVQLLKDSVPMDAASELVIFENEATPFVTDSSKSRMALALLVAWAGLGAVTVTAPAATVGVARFTAR